MYSTNQPKSPLVAGQEVPATGIPIASPNQQYYPPPPTTQSYNGQPPPAAAGTRVGRWSTGLCDCFSDVPNCCITCWCPCITFGQIAEIVDQGSTSCGVSGALYAVLGWVTGCACLYSCFYRSRLRSQYMLEDGPCCDCCVHFCCEACALCQEYRELKNRGFDMSLGWHGNMTRMQNQQQGMAPTAPMVEMGMKR